MVKKLFFKVFLKIKREADFIGSWQIVFYEKNRNLKTGDKLKRDQYHG